MPEISEKPRRILVVEDNTEIGNHIGFALSLQGYETDFVGDEEQAIVRLLNEPDAFDLVILGTFPSFQNCNETLRKMRRLNACLPVIVLSSEGSPSQVVQALKSGAADFLSKPINYDDFHRSIERAFPPAVPPAANGITNAEEGPWSQKVETLLLQAGACDVPILLRGETGVGKEVLARRLHAGSPRAGHPFLKLNCAALPGDLVESELFGYERGAFSGAFQSTPGKFELAAGGTILLDEIGDMDLRLQAKLLQVVQDREFMRLGAKQTTRVDVRVMAATHRNLEEAIAEGNFREDLFYRLNIIDIYIPPLRERRDEILSLAAFFLQKYAAKDESIPEITPRLERVLLEHDWPGNVRELENTMRKFLVLRNATSVVEDLLRNSRRKAPLVFPPAAIVNSPVKKSLLRGPARIGGEMTVVPGIALETVKPESPFTATLAEVHDARKAAETEAIVGALSATHWNRKRAAALLQIEYKALLYKMKKLGIGSQSTRSGKSKRSSAAHACA